jgi:hypothetical protein
MRSVEGQWLGRHFRVNGPQNPYLLADPEAQNSQATIPSDCRATPATNDQARRCFWRRVGCMPLLLVSSNARSRLCSDLPTAREGRERNYESLNCFVFRLCFAVTQARSLLMPVFSDRRARRFSFEPTRISQEKDCIDVLAYFVCVDDTD